MTSSPWNQSIEGSGRPDPDRLPEAFGYGPEADPGVFPTAPADPEQVTDPGGGGEEPELLHNALALAEAGVPVLPLHAINDGRCTCGKSCGHPGKHPRTAHGSHDATTSTAQVRAWWDAHPGQLNYGRTLDGVLVWDLDPRNNGRETAFKLEEEHGRLPTTYRVATGGGGHHDYFTLPAGVTPIKAGKLGKGVDIKTGPGQYVLVPGSRTEEAYVVIDHADPVEVPEWILTKLGAGAKGQRRPSPSKRSPIGEAVPLGGRDDLMTEWTGELASDVARGRTPHELALELLRKKWEHLDQPEGDPIPWDKWPGRLDEFIARDQAKDGALAPITDIKAGVADRLVTLGREENLRGNELAQRYHEVHGKVPPGSAMRDADRVLGEPDQRAQPADTFEDVPEEPGHQVLDELVAFLHRFVVFTDLEQADALALWVMHTHAIEAFDVTPRLAIESATWRSGKTRLLELLELLCRKAMMTINVSPAAMYRLVEQRCPTLLIDEVDTIFGSRTKDEANETLRGLINGGYRRGASVIRMVGDGAGMEPKEFQTFCPVALAGIASKSRLPDTIRDRAVIINMRRKGKDETVTRYRPRRIRPEANALARRCTAWVHRTPDLATAEPEVPQEINDRAEEIWEPLIAMADAAGGQWPQRARAACLKLNSIGVTDEDDEGVVLLNALREVFAVDPADLFSGEYVERMHTSEILVSLAKMRGVWWNDPNRHLQMSDMLLAKMLASFGIRPKKMRIGPSKPLQGYKAEWFEDAWGRYPLADNTEHDE